MNRRIKELSERRHYLMAQSELERERLAGCAESIARFFSKNALGHAVKSTVGGVAGFFILRWVGKKLAGAVGKLLGRKVVQFATGFWRRPVFR